MIVGMLLYSFRPGVKMKVEVKVLVVTVVVVVLDACSLIPAPCSLLVPPGPRAQPESSAFTSECRTPVQRADADALRAAKHPLAAPLAYAARVNSNDATEKRKK